MNKILKTFALLGVFIILLPPNLHANEIDIKLESKGRLEYNLDESGNPDIIIERADLSSLKEKVTEYEENVREQFFTAFASKGMNFDSTSKVTLGAGSKGWRDLTVYQLARGIHELPESWCKNVNNQHTNLSVDSSCSTVDAVSPLNISGTVSYKLTIPKGWRTQQQTIDLSDIYREAMAAWQDSGFQNEHAKKVYHIHSTEGTGVTHEHGYNESCSNYASDTSTNPTQGGCYSIEVQHHHYGSNSIGGGCYTKVLNHNHVGGTSPSRGGYNTCYTKPWYHKHSTASTSEEQDTTSGSYTAASGTGGGCYGVAHYHSCSDSTHVNAPCDYTHVGSEGKTPNGCYTKYAGKKTVSEPCGGNIYNGGCSLGGDVDFDPVDVYCDRCGFLACHKGCGRNCPHATGKHNERVDKQVDWYVCAHGNNYCHTSSSKLDYYTINCNKTQGQTIQRYQLTCPKPTGIRSYGWCEDNAKNNIPDGKGYGLGDFWTGNDCAHYEGKIMKYACTKSYNLTSLEKWGSGSGCGKTAHQLLNMTVTF